MIQWEGKGSEMHKMLHKCKTVFRVAVGQQCSFALYHPLRSEEYIFQEEV